MVCHGFGFSPLVVDMLLSDIDPSASSSAKHARTAFYRRIPVDILEKESEFEIKADVPGVEKEAIHLDIDRDTLTLSVSQPSATQEKARSSSDKAPATTDGNTLSEPAAAVEAGGQPAAAEAADKPKVLLRERAQRSAKRTLKLPETADLGQARAECVAGVLTVTVPKRAPPSPQRIPIA